MNRKRWISTLASIMLASATIAGCKWVTFPPGTTPRQELPPRFIPDGSPPDPYEAPDDAFTTSQGDGLGQYLAKGTVRVPININRFYGPVDANGRLLHPEQIGTAYLTVRLWDVDSNATGTERAPETIRVRVNGQALEPELTGLGGQWTTFSLPLPVEALRFPAASNPVVPAENWVEFDLDANNESPGWKVWIDWVRITVTGVRPWVLVHGFLSDSSTWRYWAEEYAPARGIPVHAFSLTDSSGSMWLHGLEIAAEIDRVKEAFGVQRVHVVGSSKGGPDGRVAVAVAGDSVEQLVMIGAPNHGSELADLVKIGAILYPWLGPVTWIGEPALTELTTWYSRLASDRIPRNMTTDYSSIATVWLGGVNPLLPGLDDGVVSTASVEAVPYAPSLGHPRGFHLDNPRNEQVFALTAERLTGSGSTSLSSSELPSAREAPQVSTVIQERLAPNEARSWDLAVEEGRPATFALFWRGGEPTISLQSPSGQPLETVVIRSQESPGLTYQIVRIDQPEGGVWRATVANGPEESLVLLTMAVDSPVRLEATVIPPDSGGAGTISARVSLGGERAPLRLHAWIAYPNGRVDEVDLLADGRPGDDLLFSAPYLPPSDAYGDIPIVVGAEMEGGVRYVLTGVTLPHPTARIGWQAVRGQDGVLEATARLEGFPAGSYQLLTTVRAEKEPSHLFGHALVQAVPAGSGTVFRWPLPDESANLALGALYAFDATGRLIATGDPFAVPSGVWTSPRRLQVESVDAPVVTGNTMAFPVTFTAPAAGRVVLNARLTDGKGRLVGWATVTRKARSGRQTWQLRFPAEEMGPLYLRDLSLYVEGRPESAVLIPLAYVHPTSTP